MNWVIDASMIGAFFLPGEAAQGAGVLAQDLARSPLIAPAHWPIEIASLFSTACRKGRIDAATRDAGLAAVADLDVRIVGHTVIQRWKAVMSLVDSCGLTAYDAAYLDLALQEGCGLASNDAQLIAAARSRNVPVATLLP